MANLLELRLRAAAGDADAQFRLGRILVLGIETPQALEDGVRLIAAACAQQHADALLYNATLAALGLGRPQNFDDAFALVARAASSTSGRAKGQLRVLSDARGNFDLCAWRAPAEATARFAAPRLYTIKNFLPKSACAWLIAQARKQLEPANVMNRRTGVPAASDERTGKNALFHMLHPDLVLQLTHQRIADMTGAPVAHQEPSIILHYGRGQEYKPHYDFFQPHEIAIFKGELDLIGQRVGTFLIYLNDGYAGGETEFPRLNWRFKGEAGDALFFWNVAADGELEPLSLHAGLPVTKGEKWLFSKWIRAKPTPYNLIDETPADPKRTRR